MNIIHFRVGDKEYRLMVDDAVLPELEYAPEVEKPGPPVEVVLPEQAQGKP